MDNARGLGAGAFVRRSLFSNLVRYNVVYQYLAHISTWRTFPTFSTLLFQYALS